jgi:hypothetical protein
MTAMSPLGFCEWLASTEWSIALHESVYMYPLVESVHVLTLTVFLGSAVMLDLRLLGLTLRNVEVEEVVGHLEPLAVWGFLVMVTSGAMLFYAIPVRSFQNVFFRAKMIFLILAGLNAWIFHSGIYRSVGKWNLDRIPPKRARAAGLVSLVLWAFIVIAGRMIAYNWFDCDIQPQSAIVNWFAGCVIEDDR